VPFSTKTIALHSAIIFSCEAKKTENTHTIEKIIERQKDSVSTKEISQAITDSLFFKISKIKSTNPACDSLINIEIKKMLQQIATSKKSGANELGFYYDSIKNQLVAYGKINASLNEKIAVLKTATNSNKSVEIKNVPIKYIPKWVKILAWLGGLFMLFLLWRFYRIFTP